MVTKCAIIVSLILFVTSFLHDVDAGNCRFTGIDDSATFHNITGLRESAVADSVLWQTPTENILQAAVLPTPDIKYISGLRYLARYAYAATASFADFVTVERRDVIQRDVSFTCENGRSRAITFYFHVDDENNQAPEVEGNPTRANFTLRKSQGVGEVELFTTFFAVDLDLWEENAAITASSTRPLVFPVAASLKPGVDHAQNGWTWEIGLSVVWGAVALGEWNFQLVLSDGVWTRSVSIVVDVYA